MMNRIKGYKQGAKSDNTLYLGNNDNITGCAGKAAGICYNLLITLYLTKNRFAFNIVFPAHKKDMLSKAFPKLIPSRSANCGKT